MDHFTIFQDFYRVIAEMTEEEIEFYKNLPDVDETDL